MQIFKLDSPVEDSVTGVSGTLTHATINMDGHVKYIFQPKGLNPSTQTPVDRIFVEPSRIKKGKLEEVDIPLHYLGEQAEDTTSGFKGTITALIIHLGNCIHAEIKPKGIIESTGATIEAHEFDIRRLKGPKIKPLSEKAKKTSEQKTPSPTSYKGTKR